MIGQKYNFSSRFLVLWHRLLWACPPPLISAHCRDFNKLCSRFLPFCCSEELACLFHHVLTSSGLSISLNCEITKWWENCSWRISAGHGIPLHQGPKMVPRVPKCTVLEPSQMEIFNANLGGLIAVWWCSWMLCPWNALEYHSPHWLWGHYQEFKDLWSSEPIDWRLVTCLKVKRTNVVKTKPKFSNRNG